MAISEALQVLGWWELPEEEQPPPTIWGLDDRLKEWWAAVDEQRKDKYAGSSGGSGEALETVPTTQNEYATELLKGL